MTFFGFYVNTVWRRSIFAGAPHDDIRILRERRMASFGFSWLNDNLRHVAFSYINYELSKGVNARNWQNNRWRHKFLLKVTNYSQK